MSVEREAAVINNQIILRCNFRYSTGDYFNPYSIAKVEILDSDGETVIETITGANILQDATGKYHVVAAAISSAKTIYDKWTFTPVVGADAETKTNTCVVWTTSAGSGGLTTLSALRTYLKKNANDTTDDSFLEQIISRISAEIEKRCGRAFLAATYTEYYKGDGKEKLLVRHYPVNSITSIHIDEDRIWATADEVEAGNIIISDEVPGQIILNNDYFDKSEIENVRVIYNAGYATIPSDLESACIKLCAIEYIEASRIHTKIEGERDLQSEKDKIWKFIVNNFKAVNT